MAEQNTAGQDAQDHTGTNSAADVAHAADKPGEPAATSQRLDHLQHTIDDAKAAAKKALSDQPEI